MSDNTTPPPGPEGQDPNANPYGQNPYGQNPYGQQPPAGNDPYGQPQYGHDPYAQQGAVPPYGNNPYGQPQYGAPQPPAYSVGAAFSWAWNAFKANLGLVLGLILLPIAASIVLELIGMAVAEPQSLIANLLTFIGTIISFALSAALIRAALNIFDGKQVDFATSFQNIPWVAVVLTSILTSLAITIGTILCVVPGLAAALFLMFGQVFAIDRNVGPIEALKGSFRTVRNSFAQSLLFALSAIGVILLGLLACCVGVIVAAPIALLAQVYTYRALGVNVSTD